MGPAVHLLVLTLLPLAFGQLPPAPKPRPRIVIVGPTGAGKSSLANALLGCDPTSGNCIFPICSGLDSCTKETTYGVGQWLGTGQDFTVVDTPGFGDTDDQEEELIDEMTNVLNNEIGEADVILLLLKGSKTRFSSALQTMLKRMTIIFGRMWWDHVVIGASFWQFDQVSIDRRRCYPDYPDLCRDEAWLEREINQQIRSKLGVEKNFTYIFADSWSQTSIPPGFNKDDEQQQERWLEETGKLWQAATEREEAFQFKTINDIIEENNAVTEENARQKREITRLNSLIEDNISQLSAAIENNARNIEEKVATEINSLSAKIEREKNRVNTEIIRLSAKIESKAYTALVNRLDQSVKKLSTKAAVCGYHYECTSASSVITYDRVEDLGGVPRSLNAGTGVFTAPVAGVYQVAWSLHNDLDGGEENWIHLQRNGQQVDESSHYSYNKAGNYMIWEQGGRTMVWLFICLCWNDDHHNYDRDYNHDDKWCVEDNDDVFRDNGF